MNKKQRTKANKKKKEERPTVIRKHTGTKWLGFSTHLDDKLSLSEVWFGQFDNDKECE
tara:strand:- start:150 stop:323 length:174 start_codon:yes stop_codon:yes gene_type:complete